MRNGEGRKLKVRIGNSNIITTFLMATLITAAFISFAGILPAHALTEAKVFVDPPNNVFPPPVLRKGQRFTVNVTIANMTGLAGFEFKLYWNSSLLKAVDMVENLYATVTPSGESGNIWQLAHEVAADHVHYAYTYKNLTRAWELGYAPINITTAEGYPEGKLAAAIITLKIIAEPLPDNFLECDLEITVSKPGDMAGAPIPHTVEHGYYKLIRPPLPTPVLKVEPETYEATYRNETFDINITINNLDAGWQVVGIEFKLRYNSTMLSVKNVTEGPFMKLFAVSPSLGTWFKSLIKEKYVLAGVMLYPDENGTWHEPFPSGNGTIATITFQTIQGPTSTCNLELYDTKLGDTTAKPINHMKEDGVFIFNVEELRHDIMVDTEHFIIGTISNATISPVPMVCLVNQGHPILTFNASGKDGAVCFVNVTIPKNFMWLERPGDEWIVLVGGFPVTPTIGENDTHTWLYFTFTTSLKPVQIISTAVIPEFPINVLLTLFLVLTALTTAITKFSYICGRTKTHK